MSALAGVWTRRSQTPALESCAKILAAQAPYGPHGEGLWNDEDVAVGRRLYRLLPEDAFDSQPLIGAGGRFVLVADLRLDNRDDLCRALNLDRTVSQNLADAALLLSAWERWEEAAFDHLVGDYAFAVWDGSQRKLVLARDPFGARPLHFHRGAGLFAFASMPKGLQALAEVPVGPDETQMLDFVALAPEAGSRSFFAGIERVELGSCVTVRATGVSIEPHWRPVRRPIRLKTFEDYAEGLRHHLDEAVSAQLRGAGPAVGCHLSSGLDSSSVTATAARIAAASGHKVVAFTAAPREGYGGGARKWRLNDETQIAAETAALYPNLEHVQVRVGEKSPLETLDRDFYLYDRPLLNLCNFVWIHEINNLARERKLSVMLVGRNGNAGLSYDGLSLLSELAGSGRISPWLRTGAALRRNGVLSWPGVLYRSLEPYLPGPLWVMANRLRGAFWGHLTDYTALNPAREAAVLRRWRASGGRGTHILRGDPDSFRTRVRNLMWTDPGNHNKGALAGWGLDVRDPTSDRRLVEFCLSVPTEVFLHDGRPRALVRHAMADRLPASVLDEQRRGYQGADWHEGLTAARSRLRDDIGRLESCAPAGAALDLPRMRRLVETWPTKGWETDDVMIPYRLALLRGVSAGHFLRKASGSNA